MLKYLSIAATSAIVLLLSESNSSAQCGCASRTTTVAVQPVMTSGPAVQAAPTVSQPTAPVVRQVVCPAPSVTYYNRGGRNHSSYPRSTPSYAVQKSQR